MPDDSDRGWTSIGDLTLPFDFGPALPARPKPRTRDKQLEDLLAAREAEPEAGFITRILLLCSLPRTDPRGRLQYVRRNGPYTLVMIAGAQGKLPFGNLPRLLLAWVCTEAVRTQSQTLVLGRSLADFMRKLGISTPTRRGGTGGQYGSRTRLQRQMFRLFESSVQFTYDGPDTRSHVNTPIVDRADYFWSVKRPDEPVLWESTVILGHRFFKELLKAPVPIDLYVLRSMKRSSLGLDLYMWLTYRTFDLHRPLRLPWRSLYRQFAHSPERASDKYAVRNFRKDACRELVKLKTAWPGLQYGLPAGALEIRPSTPPIPVLPFPAP